MKKISAGIIALACATGIVAMPVQAQAATKADYISPAQCKADERAIKAGQGFDPEPYYNVVQDTVRGPEFKVFINTRPEQADGIREGMRRWEEASGGRITMTEVSEPGEGVITVHNDRNLLPDYIKNRASTATVAGHATPSTTEPRVFIRPDMTDYESAATVGAHEFGHVMGLGHTCPGGLMFATSSKQSPKPILPEVEAVLSRH